MTTEIIPENWKKEVRKILQKKDPSCIKMTLTAQRDWSVFDPEVFLWNYQLYDLICDYLKNENAKGRQVCTMKESGITYEMIFDANAKRLYCKINLEPSGEVVIIYSAHPPRKGEEL
ncbi:MAG: hypothetical protein ACOCQP_02705 [Lentisphaeria bacterium]